jgi:hypothetical protein
MQKYAGSGGYKRIWTVLLIWVMAFNYQGVHAGDKLPVSELQQTKSEIPGIEQSAPVIVLHDDAPAFRGFQKVSDDISLNLGEMTPGEEIIFTSDMILLGYSDIPIIFHFNFDTTTLLRVERNLLGEPTANIDEIPIMFKLQYEGLSGYVETDWLSGEQIIEYSDIIVPDMDNKIMYMIQLKVQPEYAYDAGEYWGGFSMEIGEYVP